MEKAKFLGIVEATKKVNEGLYKYHKYYGECGGYGFSYCRLWEGCYNVALVYAPFHLRLSIPKNAHKAKAISDFICESEAIAWKLSAQDIRINADIQQLYDYLMMDADNL
jgi:hypothetical protein